MKRIVITGATGVIGQALVGRLRERGDAVIALSRDRARGRQVLGGGVEVVAWPDPLGSAPPPEALAGADAVVHLLGEPLAQRWNPEAKARIRDSRVLGTRQLVSTLRGLGDQDRPRVLVSQSATGYYGQHDDRELEEDAPPGNDFLAQVVSAWEGEAQAAEPHMRVVRTRTGVVLSPKGGALARMLPFFRLGIGGPVAGGRQYISWIHLDDVVAGMIFCVEVPDARGAVNLSSPQPVTNAEFSRALGRALKRPAVLPVPRLALSLLYGEMAQTVTTGQRVIPRRLEELGFAFAQPQLERALGDVLAAG